MRDERRSVNFYSLLELGKGFVEFAELGLVESKPRLLAVQAQGSAAIANALAGDGKINAVSGDTVADSISVGRPRDGEAAVREEAVETKEY